jgi:hypothetical protein
LAVGSYPLVEKAAGAGFFLGAFAIILLLTTTIGPAALWVFRRLLIDHPRARAAAIARTFAGSAPISLMIGTQVAMFTGGLAGAISSYLIPVGLVAGIAFTIALFARFAIWLRFLGKDEELSD